MKKVKWVVQNIGHQSKLAWVLFISEDSFQTNCIQSFQLHSSPVTASLPLKTVLPSPQYTKSK